MDNLPDLVPGQLWVVNMPRSSRKLVLNLAARLALETPLRVLDSGASRVAGVEHTRQAVAPLASEFDLAAFGDVEVNAHPLQVSERSRRLADDRSDD